MKGKILTLSLLSILATQSYAVEIKSGKILASKEWTTPNTKGFVIKNDNKQLAAVKKRLDMTKQMLNTKHIKTSDQYTTVASISEPISAIANKTAEITGISYYGIANLSQETKMYVAFANVCVESGAGVTNCTFYSDDIQLDIGGGVYAVYSPVVQTTFNETGNYTFLTATGVAEFSEEGTYRMTDYAESIGTVTVTDGSDDTKKIH